METSLNLESDTSLVLPMTSDVAETADPWGLVARGDAILASVTTDSRHRGVAYALPASSAFARQINSLQPLLSGVQRQAVQSGSALFRLELPTGTTINNLVPAVGGGFRGLVRSSAGGAKIAGHARLMPASGVAAGGIALGPAVALVAVAVAADALATHQLHAKLDAIKAGVDRIERRSRDQHEATLASAEQALREGTAALADQITIPDSVGLGPARNSLRALKNEGVEWLSRWKQAVQKLDLSSVRRGTGVDVDDFGKFLKLDPHLEGQDFAHEVSVFYRALVLDARAQVLTLTQASLNHPDAPLTYLEASLRAGLEDTARIQNELREVLWSLSAEPLTYSLPAWPSTGKQVADLMRNMRAVARAINAESALPSLIGSEGRQVLEARATTGGAVEILAPPQAA